MVNIYHREVNRLLQNGWIREIGWNLYVWEGRYDERTGLHDLDPFTTPVTW